MRVTYIDVEELAVRLAEACSGIKRPRNASASLALEILSPATAQKFIDGAIAATEYIAECCNADSPGSVEIKHVSITTTATQ
jgi:hypothetical protein